MSDSGHCPFKNSKKCANLHTTQAVTSATSSIQPFGESATSTSQAFTTTKALTQTSTDDVPSSKATGSGKQAIDKAACYDFSFSMYMYLLPSHLLVSLNESGVTNYSS